MQLLDEYGNFTRCLGQLEKKRVVVVVAGGGGRGGVSLFASQEILVIFKLIVSHILDDGRDERVEESG